jgi:glycogen synthase
MPTSDGRRCTICTIVACQDVNTFLLPAQVGGLGDVVTGLGRACLQRGHTVEVCLPFYECLPQDRIAGLRHDRDFDVPKVPPAADI